MSRKWDLETVRTVDLGYDQMLVLTGSAGVRVRVLYGSMWLTEEGDLQDRFAASGAEITLRTQGRTLVEGIGPARVLVITPLPEPAFVRRATGQWLTAMLKRARRIARLQTISRAY